MNLFHVASIFCALGGALILGALFSENGVSATIFGVIAGVVAGWFVGPLLVFLIFFVLIFVEEGPRSAVDFLRRRPRL